MLVLSTFPVLFKTTKINNHEAVFKNCCQNCLAVRVNAIPRLQQVSLLNSLSEAVWLRQTVVLS